MNEMQKTVLIDRAKHMKVYEDQVKSNINQLKSKLAGEEQKLKKARADIEELEKGIKEA